MPPLPICPSIKIGHVPLASQPSSNSNSASSHPNTKSLTQPQLKYYIKDHPRPKNEVTLRLCVNIGSLVEEEHERGIAHILEHMGFCGTTSYNRGDLIKKFEKMGSSFGPDLNAHTSLAETVYKLQVDTSHAPSENIQSSIGVLSEWAFGMKLEQKDLDEERKVVEEEWRASQGAKQRMLETFWTTTFNGTRYAERIPIGLRKIIQQCTAKDLKNFYKKWYRPENMCVVVIGDLKSAGLTTNAIEKMIHVEFSKSFVPNLKKTKQQPDFELPRHDNLLCQVLVDKELTQASVAIEFYEPLSPEPTDHFLREEVRRRIFASLVDQRFNMLTRRGLLPCSSQTETQTISESSLEETTSESSSRNSQDQRLSVTSKAAISTLPLPSASVPLPSASGQSQPAFRTAGISMAPVVPKLLRTTLTVLPRQKAMSDDELGNTREAVREALVELERLAKHGIEKWELELAREKWKFHFNSKQKSQFNLVTSSTIASDCVQHFLHDGKTLLAGEECETQVALQLLSDITVEEMNEFMKKFHVLQNNGLYNFTGITLQLPHVIASKESSNGLASNDALDLFVKKVLDETNDLQRWSAVFPEMELNLKRKDEMNDQAKSFAAMSTIDSDQVVCLPYRIDMRSLSTRLNLRVMHKNASSHQLERHSMSSMLSQQDDKTHYCESCNFLINALTTPTDLDQKCVPCVGSLNANASDHVTNGSSHVTNASSHVTNGSSHKVTNGSSHVTNGSSHKVTNGSSPVTVPLGQFSTKKVLITGKENELTYFKLKNGIEVFTLRNNFQLDQAKFQAFALGGNSELSPAENFMVSCIDKLISDTGLGTTDALSLPALRSLSKTRACVQKHFFHRGLGGSCGSSSKYFEFMLQQLHCVLTKHEHYNRENNGAEALRRVLSSEKSRIEKRHRDTDYHFGQKLLAVCYGGGNVEHIPGLLKPITHDILADVSVDKINHLHENLFMNCATEFAFVFVGDLPPQNELQAMLEVYLSHINLGLAGSKRLLGDQLPKKVPCEFPTGIHKAIVYKEDTPSYKNVENEDSGKTTVVIAFNVSDVDPNQEFKEKKSFQMVASLVKVRLLRVLRQTMGQVYNIGCSVGLNSLSTRAMFQISFICSSVNAENLVETSISELKKMCAEQEDSTIITDDDVENNQKIVAVKHRRDMINNSYHIFWILDSLKEIKYSQRRDKNESEDEMLKSLIEKYNLRSTEAYLEFYKKCCQERKTIFRRIFKKFDNYAVIQHREKRSCKL